MAAPDPTTEPPGTLDMRVTRSFLPSLALVLSLAATTGCIHTPGGASPSSEPPARGDYEVLGPVRGQDCVYYLLGIIPIMNGNETHVALEDALRQDPRADALIGVSSDTYLQYWILFSRACTQVRA